MTALGITGLRIHIAAFALYKRPSRSAIALLMNYIPVPNIPFEFSRGRIFQSTTLLLVPVAPSAVDINRWPRILHRPYALCSTSYCKPILGNTSHAKCICEGPFSGSNFGNSSCKARTGHLIYISWARDRFSSAIQPLLSRTSSARVTLRRHGPMA